MCCLGVGRGGRLQTAGPGVRRRRAGLRAGQGVPGEKGQMCKRGHWTLQGWDEGQVR